MAKTPLLGPSTFLERARNELLSRGMTPAQANRAIKRHDGELNRGWSSGANPKAVARAIYHAEAGARRDAEHSRVKMLVKAPSHTYASPEIKRTASYKRAERLETSIAPKVWETLGLTRSNFERLADAWERAGFLGWADNYRAAARRKFGRDPSPARRYPRQTAATRAKISSKVRLLIDEGYPPKQAVAIVYRMYGARKRPR